MTTVFSESVAFGSDLLEALSSLPFSSSGNRRVCMHSDERAALHVMVVQSATDVAYPPHAHSDSDEVLVAMRGRLEVSIWRHGSSAAPEKFVIGFEGDDSFCVLVPRHAMHSTRPLDENCTYLEVKRGPFVKEALILMGQSEERLSV